MSNPLFSLSVGQSRVIETTYASTPLSDAVPAEDRPRFAFIEPAGAGRVFEGTYSAPPADT